MKSLLRLALLGALTCLLAACATTSMTQTRVAPERTLSIAAPAQKVKASVAAAVTANGYVIKDDTEFLLSFDRPSGNVVANLFFGSDWNPQANYRIIFQFIGDNPTQVSWHSYIVTNPGTGMERLVETTDNPNSDPVEQALQQIKASLESKASPPPRPTKPSPPAPKSPAANPTGL